MQNIRKKALLIAGVIFACLSVNRIALYVRDTWFYRYSIGDNLNYVLLTATYIVFALYCFLKNNRYIGLLIGSIVYTLVTVIDGFSFTNMLIIAGSALLVAVLFMLYKGNPALLQTVWFIPGALIFAGFFLFDLQYGFGYLQFKDLLIYFEPLGVLLMCLGLLDLE